MTAEESEQTQIPLSASPQTLDAAPLTACARLQHRKSPDNAQVPKKKNRNVQPHTTGRPEPEHADSL